MKYTELKNDITSCDRRIYLLEGEDAYFAMHGEEQIKAAFLTMPELNFVSFDGADLKGKNVSLLLSAMTVFPFMAEKRIIKVTDFFPTEQEYEKNLKQAFENCPESTILIIVNRTAGKGADLKRKKCITYVDCSHADEETVTRWVYVTLKKAGVKAEADACRDVAAFCLCDMSRVSKETEKLIAYGKSELSRADVCELVYKDADYRIYEMTEALARKNYARFCAIYSDMLSKGTDGNVIISSLHRYFKNLLIILSSPQSDAALASSMKMKEYGVKKSREQAANIGRDKLEKLIVALYDFSAAMRSGKLTPEGAFDCAVAKVLLG